ncbi:MAG: response regulator transcription factor [Chloroflexi bacterium]|nr:response regulator transcription factor [Chloroflexota bacterium]
MTEAREQAKGPPEVLTRYEQHPPPARVAVALAVASPLVREGLRRVIEGDDSFEVVWAGQAPPGSDEDDWARAKVAVIGGAWADGEAADPAGALGPSAPAAAKVLLLETRETPPSAAEAQRLGIAACLPPDAQADDVLVTLRAVARGYTLLSTAQPLEVCPPIGPAGAGPTAREAEVLRLLADGLGNHEIAERLCLSPRTVQHHLANLFAKTEAHNRTQLVALARQSGWLD